MTGTRPLGPLVHSFFLDHLITVKGLRPASVRSYRDTIRLLLCFIAGQKGTKITKLDLEDLSFERVLGFLRYLEDDRDNHVRTRNQRLAALHTLFDYIAGREPEMLGICQRVAAIPMKRAAPAETHFLERDEVQALLRRPAPHGPPRPARPRPAAVPLQHRRAGAGGRRPASRTPRTRGGRRRPPARQRRQMADLPALAARPHSCSPSCSTHPTNHRQRKRRCSARPPGRPLTRFGIYKIVRRHAGHLDDARTDRTVSPHIFRHTAAVHLLEAGVEVNVIRGWLGHADLTTTNRYAEINTKAKIEALRNTEPPGASAGSRPHPIWRSDESLLNWLSSL